MGFAGFGVPKKNKEIHLLIDFHSINDHLIQTKYPLATLDDILQQIFKFNYARNLDINMEYLSISLNCEARKILMLVTTFGLYECFVLSQGIKPVTGMFQGRIISLFVDMKKQPSVDFDKFWLH